MSVACLSLILLGVVLAAWDTGFDILGTPCDSLVATGCNPFQLPVYHSGDPYLYQPSLLQLTGADVRIDNTSSRDASSTVVVNEDASSASSSDADSFGISGSVPFKGLVFSAGIKHQSLVQDMHSYTSSSYYSEIERNFVVHTATINDITKVALSSTFSNAVGSLPETADSEEDAASWLALFSEYGTHYVKAIAFGGRMRLTTFLSSSITSQSQWKQGDWDFFLDASFKQECGINVSWDSGHTQEDYNQFSAYQSSISFFAIGGDTTVTDYDQWLKTVSAQPGPIKTTLGSLSELLPASKTAGYTTALQKYYEACPHTDAHGVCNGYGHCSISGASGTCQCSAAGSYLESDGNCYPQCECSGNGNCSFGLCKCHVDDNGFGFTGSNCQEKCGTKVWDAGDGGWCIPGTSGSDCKYIDDYLFDHGEGDCMCQGFSGIQDSDMHSVSHVYWEAAASNTYHCNGDLMCENHWYSDGCGPTKSFTCQYGPNTACSTDHTAVPAPNVSLAAAMPMTSNASGIVH